MIIIIHLVMATFAVALGGYVLAKRKGTPTHRAQGRVWVFVMATLAVSSFGITDLRDGQFSVVHLLSVFTLGSLLWGIVAIRSGQVETHQRAMLGVYIGLISAGAAALLPGRFLFGLMDN